MISGLTKSKAESLFQKCFLKFAKLNGYDVRDRKIAGAYKKTSFGYLWIGNTISDYAFKLHAFCSVTARLDEVENIITSYIMEIEEVDLDYYAGNFVTLNVISFPFEKLYTDEWELDFGTLIIPRSEEGINRYCTFFEVLMNKHLLPLAESLLDYKTLESKLREATSNYEDLDWETPKSGLRFSNILNLQYFQFRMLIIAKLAGVADFDEVYKKLSAINQELLKYGGRFAKYPSVLYKIYHQLKTL